MAKITKRTVVATPKLEATGPVPEVQAKYGDVFALIDAGDTLPVGGKSYYIFLEQTKTTVSILHPFSLKKANMTKENFANSIVPNDWNPSSASLASMVERKILLEKSLKREVPAYLVELQKHYEELVPASI